jgi:hypothetical protein
MNQLGTLGYTIWDTEFGDHTGASDRASNAVLISGYLEANLGQLNILLNKDYGLATGTDVVSPVLKYEENAIFTQIYLKDFYKKQARNTLRNITSTTSAASTGMNWTELREGDSYIKRDIVSAGTKTETSRLFQAASKDAADVLRQMIYSYNMYGSIPTQVAGKDAIL